MKTRLLFAGVLAALIAGSLQCADEGNALQKKGCRWNGNCSGLAPEGAYDCSGNAIVQCLEGKWEHVISCGSVQNGRGYYCTCKGGCGVDYTECSYAFEVCAGQSYETCGPDATAVMGKSWDCQ